MGKRPQAPGGPAPKPWGPGPQAPWRPGPQAPGAWIPPLSLISCKPSLTSCCVSNPWVRVSKRYHNPQSADLGGRWMVSEGGAVQFHERRGSRLRSSISAAGPGPKRWGPGQQASPASRSRIPKMPRCSSAHEKPGLLHRLISCAQSLQPSLTFLLRRNNKVQGARSDRLTTQTSGP